MKTIEFPLYLQSREAEEVASWMDMLKRVYNRGLAILEWKQFHNRLKKVWEANTAQETLERWGFLDPSVARESGPTQPFELNWVVEEPPVEEAEEATGKKSKKSKKKKKTSFQPIKKWASSQTCPQETLEAWGFLDPNIPHYSQDYKTPVGLNVTKAWDGEWAMSCECAIEQRIDRTKSWDDENVELRPSCVLVKSHWFEEPIVKSFSTPDLRKPFAKIRWEELETSNIPLIYINDYIGLVVAKAWEDYLDPNRPEIRRPRYKNKGNRVNTIPSESFRAQCKMNLATNQVKLPGLGWRDIPKLNDRLGRLMRRQVQHMKDHPDQYPELAKKLEEREIYLQVARWVRTGQALPEEPKGTMKQAIKKAQDLIKKHGSIEPAIAKLQDLAAKRDFEKAITDLCQPGGFAICRRGSKFYLQITLRVVISQGNPRSTPIGVDVGLNYLADTTNGVRIKHPHLDHYTKRINLLKQVRSTKKQLGSANWHRLTVKTGNVERKKTRCKRAHHHYYSSWFVDANQYIAVKKFEPKKVFARPVPIPKEEGEGYARNGREEQRLINEATREVAIGQFIALIKQKAADRGGDRVVESVSVEHSATPREILEASSFSVGGPQSNVQAQSSLDEDAWEGDGATPTKQGKSNRDSLAAETQTASKPDQLVSPARTPKPFNRRKRKPIKERTIDEKAS